MDECRRIDGSVRGDEGVGMPPVSTAESIPSPARTDTPVRGQASPRFHDLDSLRAAMMLLGLVFHAAWFFQPLYFGHTLSDVGGSDGYLYFFAWVHQFRMHVFFLIAGFFACLLVRKRGAVSFAKNRWLRIVVPLVLSMLTIWPLMKLQYLRGGLESGRILSDEPLMTQYWVIMAKIDWANEWIVHLWFLYCLILIYLITWIVRLVFVHVVDRKNRMRPILESAINQLTRSHVGPFVLAVPVAACMSYDLT
jgi:glucan biosynthesis protein C